MNNSSLDTSSPGSATIDLRITHRIPGAASKPISAMLEGFGLRRYALNHAGASVIGVPRSIADGIAASIKAIANLYPKDCHKWVWLN